MIDNKFALAIVGLGGMGNWHREWIRDNFTDLFIYGAYDIKQERLDFAKSVGLHAYNSLEEVLNDPNIDIVLCSTPNDCHKDIVIKVLRAGKTAISEKPVTLCSLDLQEMIGVAKETGKLFTVHQNRRWDKDFLTMKNIYDNKTIGDVYCIESRVHGSRGIPGDWRGEKIHGGGMMLDWGVHIIDQMLMMVPERIRTVYCKFSHITNYEVDDGFKLLLTFESGKTAQLEVGTSNFIELPRWYMLGETGTAIINGWDMDGKIVRVKEWKEEDVIPIRAAAGLTKTMAPRNENTIFTEPLPDVPADLTEYYRNIMETMQGKTTQLITHKQLLRVMRLMEACFESDKAGTTIDFE